MSDFILNWKVAYNDGTTMMQVNPNGIENKYTDIDRSKLEAFQLFTEGYNKLLVTVILGEDSRLVYRRRVITEQPSGEILHTIYLAGWQKTINGKNIQSICHVMGDGSIISAPEFLTLDRYTEKLVLSPVELRDDEK